MEGGAVAQVAEQEEVPWAIVRVISDNADDNSAKDFDQFLKDYILSSWELIDCFCKISQNFQIIKLFLLVNIY